MVFKAGESGNKNGRPRGSRNKVQADRDVSRAMTSGKSLEDIVVFLSNQLDDDKISAVQKNKYLDQLLKIKLEMVKLELKIIEDNQQKSKNPKESSPKGEVKEFPKAVFKRN